MADKQKPAPKPAPPKYADPASGQLDERAYLRMALNGLAKADPDRYALVMSQLQQSQAETNKASDLQGVVDSQKLVKDIGGWQSPPETYLQQNQGIRQQMDEALHGQQGPGDRLMDNVVGVIQNQWPPETIQKFIQKYGQDGLIKSTLEPGFE